MSEFGDRLHAIYQRYVENEANKPPIARLEEYQRELFDSGLEVLRGWGITDSMHTLEDEMRKIFGEPTRPERKADFFDSRWDGYNLYLTNSNSDTDLRMKLYTLTCTARAGTYTRNFRMGSAMMGTYHSGSYEADQHVVNLHYRLDYPPQGFITLNSLPQLDFINKGLRVRPRQVFLGDEEDIRQRVEESLEVILSNLLRK